MKTLVFTGGHHTGALEVAKALKAKGWKIVWFGHRYAAWGDTADSAEYREVTAENIKFYNLLAGKFHKTYNPLKLIRIPFGFLQALLLLLFTKPLGIISFGGYLAVPVVIMGWLLGIPSITHEQTLTQGWANKLISKFVRKTALTWPGGKGVVVGLPVRKEILEVKAHRPKGAKPLIFITGGKQGAHVLNVAIFAAVDKLLEYEVLHQIGSNTEFNDLEKAKNIKNKNYKHCDYQNASDQAQALADAEVVVSRAGAHIVYELGILGKKCVFVPIPWSSHDEQLKNAQILEKVGNAIILPQEKLTEATLVTAIEKARQLSPKTLELKTQATSEMVNLIEHEIG
jgi:UDP-N-acetylglucosamine--N-acetylmuramyl-(pentapeptide) pyrophosphoryl-undecaprenol N-acetylglucosamine transferase